MKSPGPNDGLNSSCRRITVLAFVSTRDGLPNTELYVGNADGSNLAVRARR